MIGEQSFTQIIMHTALSQLLQDPRIWRGDGLAQAAVPVIASGHDALHSALPGGGWPLASVSEIIPRKVGCGELRLLWPALASLSRHADQHIVLINPPYIPYPPAWQAAGVALRQLLWLAPQREQDAQWAMEQALREPACRAVLGWFDHTLSDRNARRLQLAAERGGGCGFVLRVARADRLASPFALRIGVDAAPDGMLLRILKRRGAPYTRPIFIALSSGVAPHAVAGPTSAESAAGCAASGLAAN